MPFFRWTDDQLPLRGWWSCEQDITPEQFEHDKPLLLEALKRGHRKVMTGEDWWWRRRYWEFKEQKS